MSKIRFTGFSQGAEVSLSATKDGVTRGPLTVSAWRQPVVSGSVTFSIHSLQGDDDSNQIYGLNQVNDGDIIEMVAPAPLILVYKDVTGTETDDRRRLTFTTDYGERYDAQHLEHPYLPSGFTTPDPTGARLGIYPGYTSGHAFRGTDMAGNQVLTADSVNPNGPVGTVDRTVTCTVSDGVNTGQKTFTVRLIHPDRYYTDLGGSTYAPRDGGGRRGCVYVSRDGDFSGAPPNGGGISHITLPDGVITNSTFSTYASGSCAIFLKGGETYFPAEQLGLIGAKNSLFSSWGSGKAIVSGERLRRWSPEAQYVFRDLKDEYSGHRFSKIDFHMSDYDVSDPTWREWWNILKYRDKTGTITENSNASSYNGDVLTNGNQVWAQVIADDGVDTLLVRQVVTNPGGSPEFGDAAAFSDGDRLTGPNGSVTFVAAGSRQDRTQKTPPGVFSFPSGQGASEGAQGLMVDDCIVRGAAMMMLFSGRDMVFSDLLIRDYWNYGIMSGDGINQAQNAVVCVLPSSYQGSFRDLNSGVHPLRNEWNIVKASGEENIPAENVTSHAALRIGSITALSMYKCGVHYYGGHGAGHQPAVRMPTSGTWADNVIYAYQHGCFFSGGALPIQFQTLGSSTLYTPRAWVVDQCWFRNAYTSTNYAFLCRFSNVGIKNTRVGWPAGETPQRFNRPLDFMEFNDEAPRNDNYDDVSVPNFVENCTFEYQAETPQDAIRGFDTSLRGIPVSYSGNSVNIDTSKFSSVASFP